MIDTKAFAKDAPGSTYVAPQVMVDVDHGMKVMMEETFGPVRRHHEGQQATTRRSALMNDSPYGLTAVDLDHGSTTRPSASACSVETGTVFMNRCDYLDPALAWTGVKDTGRGATLSKSATRR